MKNCVIAPNYIPNVSYFFFLSQYESFSFDEKDKFQKQSYRNRCEILLSNKVEKLIVPVKKPNGSNAFMDIEIDYSEDWQKKHWRSIQSGYGKTPFFEYYAPYLEAELTKNHTYLFQLNKSIIKTLIKCLNLQVKEAFEEPNERISKLVTSKKLPLNFQGPEYEQPFGEFFHSNLSVIDILFNTGPESLSLIKQYKTSPF